MRLTHTAERVLRDHVSRPDWLFYDDLALGSMYYETELPVLESAYAELVAAGLVEWPGDMVGYFGRPTKLYRATSKGADWVAAASASIPAAG